MGATHTYRYIQVPSRPIGIMPQCINATFNPTSWNSNTTVTVSFSGLTSGHKYIMWLTLQTNANGNHFSAFTVGSGMTLNINMIGTTADQRIMGLFTATAATASFTVKSSSSNPYNCACMDIYPYSLTAVTASISAISSTAQKHDVSLSGISSGDMIVVCIYFSSVSSCSHTLAPNIPTYTNCVPLFPIFNNKIITPLSSGIFGGCCMYVIKATSTSATISFSKSITNPLSVKAYKMS